jgi:hypothetical protein
MYNNGGTPAFEDTPTLESHAGTYAIKGGTDFTPPQNFLIGLVDHNGHMKPAACVANALIIHKYISKS